MKNLISFFFLFRPSMLVFSNPEKKLQRWFLDYILRSLIAVFLSLFVVWLFSPNPFDPFNLLTDLVLLTLIGIMFGLLRLAERGHMVLAGVVLVVSVWLGMAYIAWIADGVRDLALLGHFIIILIAGLILGWQSSILVAVSSTGYIYMLTVLQRNGVLHPTLQPFQEYARDLGSVLILMAVITILVLRSIRKVVEELRLSEERFRNAFENAPIGMAIVGLDEQILQANQALCDILGYSRERLTSTTIPAITHPEDRPSEEVHKEGMSAGDNSTFSITKRYVHADGHTVWGRLKVSLVFDANRQRLFEVLQNLVDNAAKFMGGQAEPLIEIGQAGEENGNPVFYVKDNGIEIPPEYFERVFGLFNKLDAKSEGTGIGLALVKRILEVHGGRIWVESERGKGSTFFLTLPVSSRYSPELNHL
jgi:PAS domain S-box-containing protein